MRVTDFRPISLIHSIAKIFSKLLANKLAPQLNSLVSNCQSVFIKKRSLHDNFLYIQGVVRKLHRQKILALFMKLDIHKAFDTVNWGYLLEVLQALGFRPRWREWVSILFHTSSSTVLLNGRHGPSFSHARGVQQGDPLSPMLFILAMDSLQRLLDQATQHGILTPLPLTAAKWRTSMYADDAAIFIDPKIEDVEALKIIFQAFGSFSGLHINLEKSSVHPIRCENVDL
jgi:retron-type reverse transcriptase